MVKRVLLKTCLVTFLGRVGVAHPAPAGDEIVLALDMVTSGNDGVTLGTVDQCASIGADADADGLLDNPVEFDFDVTIDSVPMSAIAGMDVPLTFSDVFAHVSHILAPPVGKLTYEGGGSIADLVGWWGDPPRFLVSAAILIPVYEDTGPGVLCRLTFGAGEGAPIGIYGIRIGHDLEATSVYPGGSSEPYPGIIVHDSLHDPQFGRLALGVPCDWVDTDGDLVDDDEDNCPLVANPDQTDTDDNGIGDECEIDFDGDGYSDDSDNCALVANPAQTDTDDDGEGDACDDDDDEDGVSDSSDNCELTANSDQADADDDGAGNECDPDDDNDVAPDEWDNCPLMPNEDQADADGDGAGDVCDDDDEDDDGWTNDSDNCVLVANPDQKDSDGDGIGDACDQEIDPDGGEDTPREDASPSAMDGDRDASAPEDDAVGATSSCSCELASDQRWDSGALPLLLAGVVVWRLRRRKRATRVARRCRPD